MPQWMQDLTTGWPMIRANLPTFAVILVLMVAVVWWFVNLVHGSSVSNRDSIINNKDSEIALLRTQRDEYKNKLSGATPDEAKAKIDTLERRVRLTVGKEWAPLSKTEIAALANVLQVISKTRIQIMYENALGKELAESILEAFKIAGWDGAWITPGSGFGSGILVGRGHRAIAVRAAIEGSTNLKNVTVKDQEVEMDRMFLGVGINSY
jgi:hypothetical protein